MFSFGIFQVIVEGVRGPDWQGDIAVDDFKFKEETCHALDGSASSKYVYVHLRCLIKLYDICLG